MTTPYLHSDKVAKEDAALQVISLQKLLDGDQETSAELLKACKDLGFFYLDCRNVSGGKIMEQVQEMYDLATGFYDMSQEEKSRWLVDRDHDEDLVMG